MNLSLSLLVCLCLWGAGLVTMATTSNGEANKGKHLSLFLSVHSLHLSLSLCPFYISACRISGADVVSSHGARDFLDLGGLLMLFPDGVCLWR